MASPPLWSEVDDALDAALDLDGDARESYLATLSAPLRQRLDTLLDAALADDPVLDHPDVLIQPLSASPEASGDEPVERGVRIGPYAIEALVGEGGMGRVYRARRADGAFEQTVAVKIVRQSLTLAGSDVAARLRRERDLLAALDHPGIARLIDGGETEDGVPYLVTEFIDGAPITAWADARGLDTNDRVRLLVDVARSVDHAHRRFVIHRDLKPSNVLVTERDGAARPVVLDFGIAKLMEQAEDDGAGAFPITRTGMRLLTPAYAAPELYDPTASITTSADVYGVGALLYELLTGSRPFEDTASGSGTSSARASGVTGLGPPTREPTRPSQLATGTPEAARQRRRALAGDLDTICLKALHLDPSRRYGSAAELADDLERYLSGRPVEARRDSAAYVIGRFARRHRTAVTAGAFALVALIGGFGSAVVSLLAERDARAEAEMSTMRAREAATLLAGLFETADPAYDNGRAVTAREALDRGVERVGAVESSPLRAYLLGVLGQTYIRIGEVQRADSLLAASLATYGKDDSSPAVSELRIDHATTREALGDYAGALALGQRVYADHPQSARLAGAALWILSRAHKQLGQTQKSLERAEENVALSREDGGPRNLSRALSQLGETLTVVGRPEDALSPLRESITLYEQMYGREDMRTYNAVLSLADALVLHGEPLAAEGFYREAQAFQARVYGPNLGMGYTLSALAGALTAQGRHAEAAAALDSAIEMSRSELPEDHPDLRGWLTRLAAAHNRRGAHRAAMAAASEARDHATACGDAAATRLAEEQMDLAQRQRRTP